MLLKLKQALPALLLICTSAVMAEDAPPAGGDAGGGNQSDLPTYLQNLGKYFGYDITQYCTTGSTCGQGASGASTFSNLLLNSQNNLNPEVSSYYSFLGALLSPGSSSGGSSGQGAPIVNGGSQGNNTINSLAATTFPSYGSSSGSGVSASALIDQTANKQYLSDPVSQAVFNILATPNSSYCVNNDGTWKQQCQYLYRSLVMSNVIGTLPSTDQFFTSTYTQGLVSQLNSNALLSPLLFSTNASGQTSTSSPLISQDSQNQGLTANSQVQEAANFIRYVTGQVNPVALPDRNTYDSLYNKALNLSKNTELSDQLQAQTTLTDYLTRLRTYAAQVSVGVSNLYYILSKRMPQSLGGSSGNTTSQALSEYTMATWRLFNSDQSSSTGGQPQQQWVEQINTANSATVQKEIAVLLAEINYQMYLSRQQQERLLLTETILLLQNSHAAEPDAGLATGSNSSDYQNPSSSS
ncbi:IcmX (IcmY) [Legionella birminghamensis]|uniref:IcmX (IcmY) n=1 Tax=Legionella birminghamensis TaxID=28083 RepID=A0A378I7G4_9GAMM|nr:type IVB secretion system protein IcmX [Legionella birminghamensis]KTC76055.1 IcmX (IcmY) [Legionella birminghamensis]STX30782.1 IcmX (IcmY) [Legionella birminghamensis]